MAPTQLDPVKKEKVRKQVEFYFSDSNAPRDKFLMEKIEAHPEGYVELAIIAAFTRTAQHMGREKGQRPDEVPDNVVAQLADALQDSETLQVSEDKQYVKRKVPFATADRSGLLEEMDSRSIYACPFPFDSTLEDLTACFNQYAPVKSLRMRRHLTSKDFKGSVFVEFQDIGSAEKVAAMTDLVHEGALLRIEMKTAHIARKTVEREKEQADKAAQIQENREMAGAGNGVNGDANPSGSPLWPNQREPHYSPGLIFGFNIQGEAEVPTDLHFATVRNSLGGREAGIAFVEFSKNSRNGCIRLATEEAKTAFLERLDTDSCIPVGDLKAEVKLLNGEEEKEFYIRADQNRIKAEAAKRSGGGLFEVDKRKARFGDRRGRGRGRFGRAGRINNQ